MSYDTPLVDVGNYLKGSLDTVIFYLTTLHSRHIILFGKSQDIKGFFAGKSDEFTAFRPVHLDICQPP